MMTGQSVRFEVRDVVINKEYSDQLKRLSAAAGRDPTLPQVRCPQELASGSHSLTNETPPKRRERCAHVDPTVAAAAFRRR